MIEQQDKAPGGGRLKTGEALLEEIAALWLELGPHSFGLFFHVVPHTHPLLLKMLELTVRTPGNLRRLTRWFRPRDTLLLLPLVMVSLAGCPGDMGSAVGVTPDRSVAPPGLDGGTGAEDLGLPDSFFADDPPPKYCGPDGGGGTAPEPPGGTAECPDDKNREGCRCDKEGQSAPCWPGKRVHRNRGICKDGTTTCIAKGELTLVWGPCEGYVLPVFGAESLGPEACGCFSHGIWAIDNTVPCLITYPGGQSYGVSTFQDGAGVAQCPISIPSTPPPAAQPGQPWSASRLTVDCAGQYSLCYTLKAGDGDTPQPDDCVLSESCVDLWYAQKDVPQALPPLPGWSAKGPGCATEFVDRGGYGEMSVVGLSAECEAIDDGQGGRYVFHRVLYCPSRCDADPSLPECQGCSQGGSGEF